MLGELDPNVVYVTLALEGGCWMAHRSDRPGEWEYVDDRWWRRSFPGCRRVTTYSGPTLIHAEITRV